MALLGLVLEPLNVHAGVEHPHLLPHGHRAATVLKCCNISKKWAMSSHCQPWRLGHKEQIKLLLVHFWHYHSDKTLAANKNCLSQVDNFIYN